MPSTAQRDKRRIERGLNAPASITFEPVLVELVAAADGKLPTFDAVAYSGGKLYVKGFALPVVVDLKGLEVNANATILLDHDSTKRVGHPDEIKVSGGTVRVSGVISAENESSREVVASAKNKYRWQMSIGARIQAAYEVPAGKSVSVNGRVHAGPIIVASKSKLNEISFVGSGADEDNVVRIAAAATGVSKMTVKTSSPIGDRIQKAIDAAGLDVVAAAAKLVVSEDDLQEVLDGTEDRPSGKLLKAAAKEFSLDLAELNKLAGGAKPIEPKKVEASADDATADGAVKQIRAAAAAETKRIADIHTAFDGDFPEIEAKAIAEGWDVVKAELELMRAEREATKDDLKASGSTGIHIAKGAKGRDGDLTGRAIEASLCLQFGMAEENVAKHHDEKVMDLAATRDFRGISLKAMMDRSMRATGRHLGHGHIDGDTIVEFFNAERELKASSPGTFSTLATSGILSNVANKLLLDSFLALKTTIPTIFGRRNVKDFKTNTSYRLAMNGELEEVPAGGEIKHADLEETSFTFSAKTWGKMLTLTRRDIINDDLGAFQQIPQILGRKAAMAVEKQGWKLVLSNPSSFFATANKNNQSGAATALSIDSLTTAEQLFLDQIDSAGDPIMLSPRYLVTGTALAVTAASLMKEVSIIMESATTSASKRIPAINPHAGKWTPIASPWVNSLGLTGASATVWYLFADPAEEAAFVISYLNGRDTPMIESSDLDFNHLGMSWRVVYDFGVDDHEPRAAVRSVGA